MQLSTYISRITPALEKVIIPLIGIGIIFFIILVVIFVILNKKYKESEYYKQTHKSMFSMSEDKGSSAEYFIGKKLQNLSGYKKIIYNCYLPKTDTETTEVDLILIHEKGIYVFESKNYSGWIFGHEDHEMWTQVLKNGEHGSQKNHFYNPIKQNQNHVNWLCKHLEDAGFALPYYSCIVFGNSCELKDVTVTSNKHVVLNEMYLFDLLQQHIDSLPDQLTLGQVDEIYNLLFPLTQVSESEKIKHIIDATKARIKK